MTDASLQRCVANIAVFICSRSEEPPVNLAPIYHVKGKIIPRGVHDPKVSTLPTVPHPTRLLLAFY
jgi:hypothetical protein